MDIAKLNIEINSSQAKTAKTDLDRMRDSGSKAESQMDSMSNAARRLGLALAAAFSAKKVIDFVKNVTLLYARFETLGIVMQRVGANTGYSRDQMNQYEAGLRKAGIAAVETRTILTRMAQAQIDLNKAEALSFVARDAAVIAGINTSEAFERMIRGIQAGEIEILKNIGLNVSFEQSYRKLEKQLGVNRGELNETQKVMARANVVLEAGTRISGVYTDALETASKKLSSLKRPADDLRISIGEIFNAAFVRMVDKATESLAGMNKVMADLKADGSIQYLSDWVLRLIDLFVHLGKVAGLVLGGVLAASAVSATTTAFMAFQNSIFNLTVGMGLLTKATMAWKASLSVLIAAFAGWEIGKWAYDNFAEVRLAGVLAVNGIMESWIHLKYGAEIAVEGIKEAFRVAFGWIKDLWIGTLDLIAKGAAKVPFMGRFSKALAYSVEQLRAAKTESTKYSDAIKRIDEEKKNELETHRLIVDAMVKEAFLHDKIKSAAKASGKAGKDAGNDTEDGADAAAEALRKEEDRLKAIVEAYELRKIVAMPMGDDYEGLTEAFELGLDALREMNAEAGELAEEIGRVNREMAEMAGSKFADAVIEGMRNGMDGVWDTLRSDLVGVGASMIGTAIGDSISSTVSDSLYDAFDSMSMEMADKLGGMAGGVFGGIIGASIGGLVDNIFGNDDAAKQVRRQNEELIKSMRNMTAAIERSADQIRAEIAGRVSSYGGSLYSTSESYTKSVQNWESSRPQARDFRTGSLVDAHDNEMRFVRAVEVWKRQMPAMADEYSATLEQLQKGIVNDSKSFFEGIADGFRTSYEKAKIGFDATAKDMAIGLIESLDLTHSGLTWGMGAAFSKMAAMNGAPMLALDGLLSMLTEGTKDYNDVLEVKNNLIQSGLLTERQFAEDRAATFEDIGFYMADLRGETTDLDKAIRAVNSQFDDWEESLKDLGMAEANLSDQRSDAIELTKKLYTETGKLNDEYAKQAAALGKTLTGSILQTTMSADDYSRYSIEDQFAGYVEEIAAMGTGFEYLLTQAEAWKRVSLDALDNQKKATEAQKKASEYSQEASSWEAAANNFTSILDSLKYGDLSQSSVVEKMAGIQAELKAMIPTTPEDIARAQELWRALLDLGKERYQLPSTEWQQLSADATADLVDLQEYARNKQNELVNLTQAQNDILARVEKWTQDTASNTGGNGSSSYTYADLPTLKPMYDALAYFQNTKPGDTQSWAGGKLTRLENDYALYESEQGAYSFGRHDSLASIAAKVESIRKAWEDTYGVDMSKYTLPGFATGLDYVPREMPVRVHAQEAILNAQDAKVWREKRYQSDGDVITVSFTVNGAKNPEETARLARKEIEDYLDGRGRRKIQQIASGK